MASFVLFEGSFRILDLENSKVEIVLVELLEQLRVHSVLQLGDAQIFYLNGVGDGPVEADWYWRQIVRVLD